MAKHGNVKTIHGNIGGHLGGDKASWCVGFLHMLIKAECDVHVRAARVGLRSAHDRTRVCR